MDAKYNSFLKEIRPFVDGDRIYTDDLRLLTWGTDAGFYRLIPKIVIRSVDETEVSRLLAAASRHGLPVTFRAAGTSLSGQSITDSILIVAGKHWEGYSISPDGSKATFQPGVIGMRANELLKPYGRTFGPDPASKRSAMIGGIVMNNASGMSCGVHANSDRVIDSARIVLADGSVLDTSDAQSRIAFCNTHKPLVDEISAIRDEIKADKELAERIAYKYSIKN
ncbi:MAG: FAD-binding oxidoreductase, partial [Muribaculaceae bacterium]|nr:FAD-binding oxidoreductase [Muribaculaceae bacterium]